MALTEARLQKVKSILDWYGIDVGRTGVMDCEEFEKELKFALKIGNLEFRAILLDMAKLKEYLPLAALYMERGYPAIAAEFQATLAGLYGVSDFHAENRVEKRKAFWAIILPYRILQ